VARRIAHEIKNPLTPIQLAAERLQRRFGGQMGEGSETFQRLTSTIVRQVGDLRRMVDEFSSFARMPKPVFREENLSDIVKQAVFLHDVANPAIKFSSDVPAEPSLLVCDRRLLTQALTNVIKNAVEAIGGRAVPEDGAIQASLAAAAGDWRIMVTDNGVGLPAERDKIAEPYVTMREGGTGLGLAIVKKIVEEHGGQLAFGDNDGGGSVVTITLPMQGNDSDGASSLVGGGG
jgi:two-component system, NtrC family, nitrogen regulation sensor histidine kinase NtrY